jgi:CubicO group peptidase (beta-lactamase class C family)
LDIHNDNSNRTILHHAESRRALNVEQEISQLQTWLDDQVSTKNTMVGVSAFIVAGSKPIHTVTSGKAVLAKAWDATNKKGVQSSPKDVTPNTVSMWASTSKLITWTSLSMLLDAGKFGLDDPVDEVLPFKVRNPNFPNIPVTYRHLYAHTSGLIGTVI